MFVVKLEISCRLIKTEGKCLSSDVIHVQGLKYERTISNNASHKKYILVSVEYYRVYMSPQNQIDSLECRLSISGSVHLMNLPSEDVVEILAIIFDIFSASWPVA